MGIMIQTAVLVIAVLAVRKLFGERLHAYIRYSLWLPVVLRLLIPVNLINSPASLLRVTDMTVGRYQEVTYVSEASGDRMEVQGFNGAVPDSQVADTSGHAVTEERTAANDNNSAAGNDAAERYEDGLSDGSNGQMAPGVSNSPLWADSIWQRPGNILYIEDTGKVWERLYRVFRIIRITGSLLVGGFLLAVHYRFQGGLCRMREPLRKDQPDGVETLPVYHVKGLESPCLAGVLHPAVYIGSDIKPGSDYFRYIMTHEKVHYLHGDHIWALLRAVLVTMYWFHPFVWIAAAASARDGEIACDYGTVRRLGDGERMSYGTMLLEFSGGNGRKRIYSYGTMLRPGRSEMKERILRLAGGKGSRMWAGVLAVLFMFVVAGCAFTGTSQESSTDGTGGAAEADASLPGNEGNEVIDSSSDSADIAGNHGSSFGESDASGITSGTESEGTDNGENSVAVDVFDPDESISVQRQLTMVSAALSEETPFGADGPFLDYAGRLGTGKESIIIFHDYFGLVVYDLTNRKVLHSLDLARIDCHMTQGDNACRIKVSDDGTTVWLHPGTRQYMFRYEVEHNLLYQVPIVKTFDIDLEAEQLFDRYLVTEEMNESWHSNYLYEEYKDERGLQTAYIYLWISGDDEQRFGSLQCVWDEMVYILCDQDGAWLEQAGTGGDFPYHYDGAAVDVEILYDVPCAYSRISDSFGSRANPVTGDAVVHEGIDYAAEEGTAVTAAADGVVYEKGNSDEHGIYVVLLHANGDMTYYCHCREVVVSDGAQVKRGEEIAAVGNTGRSTGAHLHFALSRNGRFVDPAEYMEGYIVPLEEQ